ncbi:MAG: Glycosyltransferase, group 1 family protein [Candidatus Moranbacteria bacterium GW2011_GWA2_39_41]|nr:MAG: Glycosyltransferase, group 1 family protein [Candidatus Moranbacteria bacterium GW2011_GWA2_39_41]
MKLFLIKLGKAWNVLRRDGILGGGKRIFGFFKEFVKNIFSIRAGDILFVTAGVGDSALYRAHNQAEELRLHGFSVSVTMQDNPFLPMLAKKFKVFVFHRTMQTPAITKMIEKIKAQKGEIIFETDDLVFDVKYIQQTDHYKNMSFFEKKQYEKGIGEDILKDPYVKVCTTSTQFIAKKLAEYGKQVFVTTNKLSQYWLDLADQLLQNHKQDKEIRDKVRIGYFSGTVGHNKDFATISEALIEVLQKYPQVEIFLAGPLVLEEKFNALANRFVRSPYVSRDKHFENIFYCDIILAPLEMDDFSEGKSELKFSEAGLLEVPVVAARNQTFSGAITDGENGFLADHKEEWVEKLSKLIEDKEFRQMMGKKAREKALQDYTTKNSHEEEYYAYLKSKI